MQPPSGGQAICSTYPPVWFTCQTQATPGGDGLSDTKIPKPPWTTGSNLGWAVLASPSDRTKFMIISQGQTHTWLYLRGRHRQNLPGGTDATQKRHEKAKRHWENRRGGRHEAHPPSPIIYIEGIESTLIIGISVRSMSGRKKLSEEMINNCAQLCTILERQGFCLFLVGFFLPL